MGGQSVISERYSVNNKEKIGHHFPSRVAVVSSDGTTEGGLGKVVYGMGSLGGQATTGDWPRNGRILL